MHILDREDELRGNGRTPWFYLRNLAVSFCVYSVVGHWIEIVYCSFMNLFGIVAEDSLVWDDPFYPFLVYGIGVAVCEILLVPLKIFLVKRCKKLSTAVWLFFLIAVVVTMLMEIIMGLMLNQPDPITGEYPLWDNSQLPFNILAQAWLVNDIGFGIIATLYTWVLFPLTVRAIEKVPVRVMNVASVLVVVGFIMLCVVKFSAPV